jgi:RNA polymerase sigma-70 factor (ECF subfamily)
LTSLPGASWLRTGAIGESVRNIRGYDDNMNMEDRSTRRARWMADAQQGDRVAYAALLDDVGPMVQQFVRRRVRDPEEAKDVYQDVLLAVHRARHTDDPTWPFEPWLFAIARRIVARRTGERVARGARELLVLTLPEIAVHGDGDAKLELEEALQALSPAQREALALSKLEGLSMEDAAARVRISVGALRVRAHRAYRALRRFL